MDYHERNERFIPVKFSVRGRDLGSTVVEAQDLSRRMSPFRSAIALSGGRVWGVAAGQGTSEVIGTISLVLILVLLYALFNSLRDSLLALPAFRSRRPAACWRSVLPDRS